MKIVNKNGLPLSILMLFAPGVVDLSDFFKSRFTLHKERTIRNISVEIATVKNSRLKCTHGHKSTTKYKGKG